MGVLLTLIAGLVVWVVLWAIGAKSFDAFLITLVMLVVAAAVRLAGAVPAGKPPPDLTCGARPRGRPTSGQPRTEGFAKIAQSAVLPLTLLRGRKGRA